MENGTLIVADAAAAGSEKWLVKDKGIFAAQNADGSTTLSYIDAQSTGVLALGQDQTAQIDLTGHNGLILGALKGQTINYGTENTTEKLAANANNEWRLGGGGGELMVNFHLTGNNKLILGNGYTQGTVTLTNTLNDFTGGIDFASSGVTLNYTDSAAVDKISLNLTYGNRASMAPMINNITASSNGILLQNRSDTDIDMSKHTSLFLGAEGNLDYTGHITVAEGQDYRFSAANGTFTITSALNGNRNLVIDAQGFTGGIVKLTDISPITGSVTVTGAGSGVNDGNITLSINQDGVLDNTTGVYLQKGATLNIGESTQHITNLELGEGSSIIGDRMSSATDTEYSTLHLTIDSLEDLKGSINVNTIYKYGEGTLELTNSLMTSATDRFKYAELHIEEGNVKLMNNYASVGSLYINGSTLDLNGKDIYMGTVVASNGALINAAGATIWGMSTIGVLEGTATMTNGGTDVTVTTNIGAAKDATLVLSGTGNWKLNGGGYNTIDEKGTLRVEDVSNLTFTYGSNSSTNATTEDPYPCVKSLRVGGILDLAESVTELRAAGSSDVQVLNFSTIKLNGQNLKLSETTKQAEWRIKSLESSGNETITWEASKTKVSNYVYKIDDLEDPKYITDVNSSRLIISDEGTFSGTLEAKRTADGRAYNSFVELAHDKALQNATLDLQGYNGANMSLAVNTDNAQIKGLKGNEHTLAYGGESYRVNQEAAPTSTRNSTLSITGNGVYEYKGAVAGLSIAMEGTGTQKFTGNNVSVANIYANSGRLEFNSGTVVTDTIYMGNGGNLYMGESYNLNAGTTLAIVGNQGEFESTLVLNGGMIAFDSNALNTGTAQFNGNMVFAEGCSSQVIDILSPNNLELGTTYTLFSDNWEGKTAVFSGASADYLQSSFTADESGLKMTVTYADGYKEWNGSNYSDFNTGTTIVFRNTQANHELSFDSATAANELRFVNDETYCFSGSDVTLNGALKMDTGKLVLNNTLTAATYEYANGSLEIATNGILHLTSKVTSPTDNVATVDNITGTGILQLHLDTANGYTNMLNISKDFTGTTHVLEGNFTLTGSSFGSTLKLADGINAQLSGNTTLIENLELLGSSKIHQNGGSNLTINGSVTGENGTWLRHGGGTLNFNGEVRLHEFNIESDHSTNNFNAKATIDTVLIDQNNTRVTFNGETSIDTFTIGQHNNTATFNGTTEFGTLNIGNTSSSTDKLTAAFNGDTKADAVNILYKDALLSGSGTLSTKVLNYHNSDSPITIDGLHVLETQANARAWTANITTTFSLKNGAVLDTRLSDYSVARTMVVGGTEAAGIMYVNGIQLSPASTGSYGGALVVNAGAHLVIAGEESGNASGDFVLAHYGFEKWMYGYSNEISVDGSLTSNAAMTLMYNNAKLNVNEGGSLHLLKGLNLTGSCATEIFSQAVYATLNVNKGARINAAGGTQHGNLIVNLAADSTLGAIGEAGSTVTFTNNMSWGTAGEEGTITIDTAATTTDENLLLTRSENQGVTVDMTGNISLKGNTALEVTGCGALKHKSTFNNAAAIRVQEGASLAVDSTAELTATTELNKGTLSLQAATVSSKKLTVTDSATFRATGGTSTIAADTQLANKSSLTYDVASGSTLNSTGQLGGEARADVCKTGEGSLHLANSADSISSLALAEGSMSVYGASSYNLEELDMADATTLSFSNGSIARQRDWASVAVAGSIRFTSSCTLNANLTLAAGSSLDVENAGATLNGALTLQQGLSLGESTLESLKALTLGEEFVLFTGVTSLTLESDTFSQISVQDAVQAITYFGNLENEHFMLTYSGNEGGTISIVSIPEPATVSLSLLALCGLAARRRRK